MTYEELQKQLKAIEREEEAFSRKCGRKEIALKKRYIKEHEPLELKYYQRIIVRMKGKRKYSIDAIFCGWWISPKGEARPCLWKKEYSQDDEILSIELHKQQPEGDCRKCHNYDKRGFCDITGSHRKSKYNKLEEGCIVCPRYEEIVEGGLWGKKCIYPHSHNPNVTFVRDLKGKKIYRIWSLNWYCFTEHSEEDIEKYYSFEPIDYSDELWFDVGKG